MEIARTHHGIAPAARLTGWRAVLARAAALLLLVNVLLPMPAFAGLGVDANGVIVCTTDGPVHVAPALLDASDESGKSPLPSGHHHENCPACRLAGSTPALPPPTIAGLASTPIAETTSFSLRESPSRAHALPRGSLAPRAPPRSI